VLRRPRAVSLSLSLLLASCGQGSGVSALNQVRGDPYPLDELDRDTVSEACPELPLITYAGTSVRYPRPVRIVAPLVSHLARLERLAVQLATGIYGRAPTTLMHAGTYVCRPIRARVGRWSEHALGNAIDLVGFGFVALPKSPPGTADPGKDLPKGLRGRFEVRVGRDWHQKDDEVSKLHAHFLHALAITLANEHTFRGLIGPPDPDHLGHLHLDMGPWQLVRMGP
jgi:hypothetical protein